MCFAIAYSAEGDFKGPYVLLQLSLALQMVGIHANELSSELQNLSRIGAYTLLLDHLLFCSYISSAGLLMVATLNNHSSGTPSGDS